MRVHLKSIRHRYLLQLLAAGAVSGTVGWAQAFSLGSSQGTAYIGKPFTSSFAVSLDAATEKPRDNCLSAVLHYGDARVMNAKLRVKAAAHGKQSRIIVSSTRPVNEPIVSVTVKGGCNAVFQRRYSFFSELSGQPVRQTAAPAVAVPSAGGQQVTAPVESSVFSSPQDYSRQSAQSYQSAAPVSSGAQKPAVEAGGSTGAVFEVPPEVDYSAYLAQQRERAQKRSAGSSRAKKSSRKSRAKPRSRRSSARSEKRSSAVRADSSKPARRADSAQRGRTPAAAAQDTAPAAAGPRLTLSSVDWTQESGEVVLRPSMELLSPVTTDEAKREEARQLWRQISAGGGEAILAADSERAVNADFMTLTQNIESKEQEIAALKSELAQLKETKQPAGIWKWLPYILGGLLLLAAALAWKFWNRLRQTAKDDQERQTWWRRMDDEPATSDGDSSSRVAGEEETPSEGAALRYQSRVLPGGGKEIGVGTATAADTDAEAITLDGDEPDDEDFDPDDLDSRQFAEFEDQLTARTSLESSAKAEELFDVQQQADFFLALGQEEQAIEILENYISEKPHASALAYLDLFGVYHSLGKKEEFVELRSKFNSLFNAEVPEYENYRMDSRGLESYENVVARIQSHWGTPKAVQLIEESVFREPDEEETAQAFDPLAYRELLLLYGIAAEVAGTDSDLVRLSEKRFGDSGFNEEDEMDEEEPDYSSTKIQGLTRTPQVFSSPRKDHVLSNVALVSSNAVKDMTTVVDQTIGDLEGVDESSDLDFNLDIFSSGGADSDAGAEGGTTDAEAVDLDLDAAVEKLPSETEEVDLEFGLFDALDGGEEPMTAPSQEKDGDDKYEGKGDTTIDFDLV